MLRLAPPEAHEIAAGFQIEPVTIEDAMPLYDIVSTDRPHLRKYMGWLDRFTEASAIETCRSIDEMGQNGRGAVYKIVHDGQYSGHTGIVWDRKTAGHEIFYWLIREKQGLGLASRAAMHVRDTAFEQGVSEINLRISPKNTPSQAVARKLRAHRMGRPLVIASRFLLPDRIASNIQEPWLIDKETVYGEV